MIAIRDMPIRRRLPPSVCCRIAFTLVEMLVVIAVIAILAGLLLSALVSARFQGRVAQCRSNLRQVGLAISDYAIDYRGSIPAVTGYPTNKLWNDADASPDSLAVLMTGGYLDIRRDGGRIGRPAGEAGGDVYGSYVYRQHAIGTGTFHVEDPGRNPTGHPIRAFALDSSCPPWPRVAHSGRSVNILFHDGSVITANNYRDEYSVMDIRYSPLGANGLPPVVSELQKVFVNADREYGE